MARDRSDDSFSGRRRNREEEEEKRNKESTSSAAPNSSSTSRTDSSENLMELIEKTDLAIDQVNSLYQMFITGIERLPPLEKEKLLDKTLAQLQSMAKPTPSTRFRFNSLLARYLSFKDRWTKLMKDLESGKIKRTLGPKH